MNLLPEIMKFAQQGYHLSNDSRSISVGDVFVAYRGESQDGRKFIGDAIDKKAGAILWEEQGFSWNPNWQLANQGIKNLKEVISELAGDFYNHPSRFLHVIGVTGTNGKTSVSHWTAQMMTYLKTKSSIIGTLGFGEYGSSLTPAQNTTLDAILLQRILSDCLKNRQKMICMEVSSHGLAQGRVNGIKFDVAVFTNLSRDHLDYHQDMVSYGEAKKKLFLLSPKAVINIDDDFGTYLANELRQQGKTVTTYGQQVAAQVRLQSYKYLEDGVFLVIQTPQGEISASISVFGHFNISNVLAVVATLFVLNIPVTDIEKSLPHISAINGRMEMLCEENMPKVFIDYAHTPDALQKVLQSLRQQFTQKKITVVFGCGGNRDVGKRMLMGQVADNYADTIILTSDNPRHESQAKIFQDIVSGIVHKSYTAIDDRGVAISSAIDVTNKQDIVLIAGKGHETYQEIAGEKIPFSDKAYLQQIFCRRASS